MIYPQIVSASLSPNAQNDDIFLALRTLFTPTRWITGSAKIQVEKWFGKYFNNAHVSTFNSGRSALFAVLRSFTIGAGDDVLVQAFTCVAVPNSVIWTGAKPVYVDVDKTLNVDPIDFVKKITTRTRAVIVQHTFGVPADMDRILEIAAKHNILVVEDCAHSLGATYKGKKVGTLGDASIFSFGRDKIVSSVFGGLAMISPKRPEIWGKLKNLHDAMPYPSGFWVLQQIVHPIIFSIALPLYRFGLGKALLWVMQRLGVLGFPVYSEEKEGKRPLVFPRKYPNGLAILLLLQLKKMEKYNVRRRSIAKLYQEKLVGKKDVEMQEVSEGAVYLRFPVFVTDPKVPMLNAKRHGILLGNWYQSVIDPRGVKLAKVFYKKGSCPKAEYAASHIINLPTNISEKNALRVIKELV